MRADSNQRRKTVLFTCWKASMSAQKTGICSCTGQGTGPSKAPAGEDSSRAFAYGAAGPDLGGALMRTTRSLTSLLAGAAALALALAIPSCDCAGGGGQDGGDDAGGDGGEQGGGDGGRTATTQVLEHHGGPSRSGVFVDPMMTRDSVGDGG